MNNLNVKVGDKVIFYDGAHREYIRTVEKVTPKGFIKVSDKLFTSDGRERTSASWWVAHITKCTPEDETRILREQFVLKTLAKMHNCKNISYGQAVAIKDILENFEED